MGSSRLAESGVVTHEYIPREKSSINEILHEIMLKTDIALGVEREPKPSLPE
jgi:hypothetical protein